MFSDAPVICLRRSYFLPRFFLNRRSHWVLDCFTGQSPGMHFYPGGPGNAREVAKSKPGSEAAGCREGGSLPSTFIR